MIDYSYNVNKNCIVQNGKFVAYVDVIDANRIVKLLNEKNKRIKDLECRINSIYIILREERCCDAG